MTPELKKRLLQELHRVPWSLVMRAFIFAAAWRFLPFWAFCLIAVAMYLMPIFQPFLLLVPFLLTLIFAGLLAETTWAALFVGALFYLVLGIKDLVFIDRRQAYHVLVFLLFLALFLNFFYHYARPDTPLAVIGLSVVFFIVLRGFILYVTPEAHEARRASLTTAVAALLVGQLALVLLVLPMSFFYQTALLFIAVVLLAEFLIDHLEARLDRRIILMNISIALVFFAVVLALNHWGF